MIHIISEFVFHLQLYSDLSSPPGLHRPEICLTRPEIYTLRPEHTRLIREVK